MATFRNPFTRKDAVRGSTPTDARLAMAGLVTQAGDLGVTAGVLSGLVVSGRAVAPTWAYSVSAGHAVTTRSESDGASFPGLDGATDTPTVSAAPATGSRWDLIWIQQRDVENADPDSNAVLGVTSGTSSGTPSKPYGSVPAGALVLAEAQVSAGAANTADALVTITGVAPRVAARGGIIPVSSTTQRDLLANAGSAANPIYVDLGGVVYRSTGSGFAALRSEEPAVTIADPGGFTATPAFSFRFVGGQVEFGGSYVVRASTTLALTAGTQVLIYAAGSVPVAYRPAAVVRIPILVRYGTPPGVGELLFYPDGSVGVVAGASGTLNTTYGLTLSRYRWDRA